MNYFYFDQDNQKQGAVSEEQLKELAAQGLITPHTPMETDTGHKGVAGQIPGLFQAAQPSQTPKVESSSVTPPHADLFCTNCGNSVAERTVACMSCGAKPTGHRKFCRHCAAALNPEQVVCTKCGTKVYAGVLKSLTDAETIKTFCVDTAKSLSTDTAKTLNICFTAFWGSLVAVLLLHGAVQDVWGNFDESSTLYFLLFDIFCGIVVLLFVLALLYQFWKLIPADIARTNPNNAIRNLFIPPFNIYWIFVVFWGLGKDMNKTLQQRGISYQVDEKLGLFFCILAFLAVFVAILGMSNTNGSLVAIACIILILFLKSVKDGAIALLKYEDSKKTDDGAEEQTPAVP